jgi:RHS repeat-associated protein
MTAGATANVTVTMRNTGTATWITTQSDYPYLLGSKNPENNSMWGLNRVALARSVAPGGQGAFSFSIKAPTTPGTYNFSWEMVRENLHWFGSIVSTTITVVAPTPVDDAQLVSASVPSAMTAGSYYNVSMTFRNSGNTTWTSPDFLLANTDDNLIFGLKRVAMSTSSVAPGQSATFNFQVRAPSSTGTYVFQWGMVWEYQHRFGQSSPTYITVSPPATPKPTISPSHTSLVAGQSFSMSWSTTNATSLSHVCSASGTGYTVNESLAVSGSRSITAQAGWVSYPSTCTWTATGPGGTTTVSETLTTSAAPTPKPGINVSRSSSLVAGQSFTTTWSTTDATSLTHVCTASGTGYTVNESLAVNGSSVATAQSGWVGYPSSCTWTASGAGGNTIFTETMTTVAGVNSSVTYIYTDGLGSPVARTDGNGNVISRTRYEPYGYVASGVQPTIGFTGHVNDVDTGLTYMQQRYYDPVAGRLLSIDPVTTDANTGGSFNRYAYASNSPYKYVDPDGRQERAAEAFSDQYRNDMASGNSDIYKPFEKPVIAVTVGMVVGPPIAAAIIAGAPVELPVVGGAAAVAKSDFIVTPKGVVVPNGVENVRNSLENAGMPGKNVQNSGGTETGTLHNVPGMKMDIRVMNGGPAHPPRVVTSRQGTSQPVDPATGKNFGNVPRNEQRASSHINFKEN